MKPLEMSSIALVWKSALSILELGLKTFGHDLQIWFPWGRSWRGHDLHGTLPPTNLPPDLFQAKGDHFAGRVWRSISHGGVTWLISLKSLSKDSSLSQWVASAQEIASLSILSEFLRMESLLGLTVKVLENRAVERDGHWDRVRNLSFAVGRRLGLSDVELIDLEMAALLHDIGKVALPAEILEEARSLTPAERKQVEGHPVVGSSMIREIPGFDRVADYVLSHHETPDGSGYPKGLKGAEIPLVALIVGAVEAFDAMTHYRPYATQRTYKDSILEMIAQTGKFDDRVLWALQDVLKNLGILDTRPMVSPPHSEGESPEPFPPLPDPR